MANGVSISALQRHVERLLSEAQELIQTDVDHVPIGLPAALDWLHYISQLLVKGQLDSEVLKQQSFGIFRLVTDDGYFEESAIGKELLVFSGELKKLTETQK